MSYKVLFDGNGSRLIRVVGLGDYLPVKDVEQAQAERDALAARVEELEICLKERKAVCHQAFDANEALKAERDALAVQADLMKAAIKNVIFKAGIVSNICYNIGQQHNESKQILQAVSEYDAARRRFNDLISLDVQQCLLDVQAEAVMRAIEFFKPALDIDTEALESYAAKVRQGGAE